MFGAVRKPSSAASSLRTTRPCVKALKVVPLTVCVDDEAQPPPMARTPTGSSSNGSPNVNRPTPRLPAVQYRILARDVLDRHVPRAAEGQRDGRCWRIGPRNEGCAQLIVCVGALDRRGQLGIAVPRDRLTAVRLLPAHTVAEQRERLVDPIARHASHCGGRLRFGQHGASRHAGHGTRRAPELREPARRRHARHAATGDDRGAGESRQRSIARHRGADTERREPHRHGAVAAGGPLEAQDDVFARREPRRAGDPHGGAVR